MYLQALGGMVQVWQLCKYGLNYKGEKFIHAVTAKAMGYAGAILTTP